MELQQVSIIGLLEIHGDQIGEKVDISECQEGMEHVESIDLSQVPFLLNSSLMSNWELKFLYI